MFELGEQRELYRLIGFIRKADARRIVTHDRKIFTLPTVVTAASFRVGLHIGCWHISSEGSSRPFSDDIKTAERKESTHKISPEEVWVSSRTKYLSQ